MNRNALRPVSTHITPREQQVLDALPGTVAELARTTGLHRQSVRAHLLTLELRRLARRENGVWRRE